MQEFEIIVIGGGLAGMSAALTAARQGRSVAIFTGGVPGGELLNIDRIEGVPGYEDAVAGYDLCPITQEQATNAGAHFIMDEASEISVGGEGYVVSGPTESATAPALILAMGAHLAKLGIPGEEEFTGSGVSHCASCDGPLLRGKEVVVAGGGDSGMQEALVLANHVAKVTIVERGAGLSGQAAYREAVSANPKIEVLTGHAITAIEGGASVEGVKLQSAAGERTLPASGVFAFIGLEPSSSVVRDLVACNAAGQVVVDAALRSSAKGVCAVGNLRTDSGFRAASAMGDGATAVMTLDRFLVTGEWPAV